MTWDQIGIAALGTVSALLLIWDRERAALIAALAAQPAWMWAAWRADQWGILFISAVYTVVWGLLLRRSRHG